MDNLKRLFAADYREAGVAGEVLPFVDDMAARYAWCDVLVCRSGAVTVRRISPSVGFCERGTRRTPSEDSRAAIVFNFGR